jgi:hypothetical protein
MIKSTRRLTLNDVRRVRGELSPAQLKQAQGGKYNDFTLQQVGEPKLGMFEWWNIPV